LSDNLLIRIQNSASGGEQIKKSTVFFTALLSFSISLGYLYIMGSQALAPDREANFVRDSSRTSKQWCKLEQQTPQREHFAGETDLDQEIRLVMENGANLEERKRQVPAIAAVFTRRTEPQRARRLAALCYLKTLGTPFMPIDIAEIALAETGNHGLSGKVISLCGARGVWQLMPYRAKSHGYSPEEMENDQKCADAAVRELACKLIMANGNLSRAKKLYCGGGPEARAYEVICRKCRREIMESLSDSKPIPNESQHKIARPIQVFASLAN
jgi:hypothetical protein